MLSVVYSCWISELGKRGSGLMYIPVCVLLCFIKPILGNRYGPGVIPLGRGPEVAGSSPFTLTTSLATPVPSSSSSNGPSNYYVDNQWLVPWRLRRLKVVWAGPKFVRPHW